MLENEEFTGAHVVVPIGLFERLAAGREQPFRAYLADDDGDVVRQFTKDGHVEIWLMFGPAPDVLPGQKIDDAERRMMVVTLQFPNYPIARLRANGISQALGQLERAIDRARADTNHAIPTRDDGHPHKVRFACYSRTLPRVAMCEICMEELVDDVNEWAKDHGLLSDEQPSRYVGDTTAATIKDAIEKAFNG